MSARKLPVKTCLRKTYMKNLPMKNLSVKILSIKNLYMKNLSARNLSVKLKLTLWNAVLMLLMVVLVLGFMMSISTSIVEVNGKKQLTKVIDNNAEEIEYDDGILEIDEVNFFKSGVYTILYTLDGDIISEEYSSDFHLGQAFDDMVINTMKYDGTEYYIYDKLLYLDDHPAIWIRGIIVVDEVANVVHSLLGIALISLPFFVLLATLGCYFISKRAFKPIDKIINLAKEINSSEDLSLRIDLGDGKDEVYELARTFDQMFAQLESSFESEKQFSSDASHELRTPTAVILAQCEYARANNATEIDRHEALEVIQRQALKMSKLIADLLNINRLDRGIEKADFKMTNFSEMLLTICEDQSLISPLNIQLSYDISPNIMLNLDQNIMTRLVTNLINNAFRYGKESGTVVVTLLENEKEIILSVKDDGIGISLDQQTKIWQRFYQVNPSRTAEQNSSMGLGLFMTKQIAKIHGANISVESEINVGSCFAVKFLK